MHAIPEATLIAGQVEVILTIVPSRRRWSLGSNYLASTTAPKSLPDEDCSTSDLCRTFPVSILPLSHQCSIVCADRRSVERDTFFPSVRSLSSQSSILAMIVPGNGEEFCSKPTVLPRVRRVTEGHGDVEKGPL